jgi:hypothetical protein
MTEKDAIEQLKALEPLFEDDPEVAHGIADHILLRFIETIGYKKVAEAWQSLSPKWYA